MSPNESASIPVTSYDDVWSGSALKALALLPEHTRDQVEALVADVCRDPRAPRFPHVRTQPGYQVASAGPVAVLFEVGVLDNLVRITAVHWMG